MGEVLGSQECFASNPCPVQIWVSPQIDLVVSLESTTFVPMSLFNNKKELDIIEDLVGIVKELFHENRILRKRKPILALKVTINGSNYIIMNTTLTLGFNATSKFVLIDNKTLLPVTATFTDQTVSTDAPGVATFVIDTVNPNQVDATPVATGSGNILIGATATYTDSNTGQVVTAPFTASYPFSVTQAAEGLTLSLTDFVNTTV